MYVYVTLMVWRKGFTLGLYSGVWEDIAPMLMFCFQKTKVTEIEFKLVSKTTFWKDLGLVFEELLVII